MLEPEINYRVIKDLTKGIGEDKHITLKSSRVMVIAMQTTTVNSSQ